MSVGILGEQKSVHLCRRHLPSQWHSGVTQQRLSKTALLAPILSLLTFGILQPPARIEHLVRIGLPQKLQSMSPGVLEELVKPRWLVHGRQIVMEQDIVRQR